MFVKDLMYQCNHWSYTLEIVANKLKIENLEKLSILQGQKELTTSWRAERPHKSKTKVKNKTQWQVEVNV